MLVSLLSWERGLKYLLGMITALVLSVAPLVGAWIEMPMIAVLAAASTVAPLVGAWIEICCIP